MIKRDVFTDAVNKYATSKSVNPRTTWKGDEVNCVYSTPEGLHCLAGQICVDLGIPMPTYADDVNAEVFAVLVDKWKPLKNQLDPMQVVFLQKAQAEADKGSPWDYCIAKAKLETNI